ncbi:hypothetical protein COW46_02820 [Candidatus Gracilibacteria bacterium CG17_big_fil_post_rev_8_21_14_2_50_48_13]|nr:MAG: hypothetical protein COW46_02820 [Candidatus Gracilibacteria bacterium CG17_big_fil_post_rev_8_21_14_2_50_48_13]
MFNQMKDLLKMQQEAKKMQKKLKSIHIEAEEGGVTITMDASMELVDIQFSDEAWAKGKGHVRTSIMEGMKKATKKAQEVAATNMKDIMGSMGLPDMPGA